MKQRFPKHLSYKYKLELDNFPVKAKDRLSLWVVLPGIFIGLLMSIIGAFELSNGMYDESAQKVYKQSKDFIEPLINHIFVDYAFIIIGLGIVAGAIIAHIRYKKIYFNGRTFDVDFKGLFGDVELFDEHLRNYRGVRLRIEFFQFGIINKNKYIIELEHIDPGKTIPLYISTDGTGIYDMWHYYAKRLDKPTIMNTDEGLKVTETLDLNKNLKTFIVSNNLAEDYMVIPPLPKSLRYAQRGEKTIIMNKRSFWDIRSVVALIWLLIFSAALGLAVYNFEKITANMESSWKLVLGMIAVAIMLFLGFSWLFKREKIVIKNNRIILIYRFFLLSRKNDDVDFDRLKDIEIMYNPVNDRHYLALITQYSIAAFGTKMPIKDLRWVKKFLIHEILK